MVPSPFSLDMAINVASFLEVLDIGALSSCSRFWNEVCNSDDIWEPLVKERWPFSPQILNPSSSSSKRWKEVYMENHKEASRRASAVVQLVGNLSQTGGMEIRDYHRILEELQADRFSFKDVQCFMLKPQVDSLVNLIGLHYCVFRLKVPVENMAKTLVGCGVSERRIRVKWWNLGRWSYGFRMKDEMHYREVSMGMLVAREGEHVLSVLRRGAVHEVFRIEISMLKASSSSSWYCGTS